MSASEAQTPIISAGERAPVAWLPRASLLVLVFLSLALSAVLIARSNNPYGTLEDQYADHLRHQRYVEESLSRGLGIYTTPARALQRFGWEDDRTYIWPEVSYPYPLGALLLHFPIGILSYRLAVDPIAVNRWLVFGYAVVGHACVLVFAWEMLLGADRGNPFVSACIVASFWLSMFLWSLDGQFEPLPILLVMLASRAYWRKRDQPMVALLAGAMFLKYQAVMLAPLAASALWRQARPHWRGALNRGTAALAVVAALDLLTFGLSYRFIQMPDTNVIGFESLVSGQLLPIGIRLLIALGLSAVLGIYLARQGLGWLALNVVFAAALLSMLPQVQGWYLLWTFPLALYAKGPQRDSVGFWALGLSYLLYQLPDPTFLSSLIAAYL